MRVVVFVVYVGESVGSVGGGGTFTATPPLGAPNGYRFGSLLPLLVFVLGEVVVLAEVVVVAFDAPEAENTPPTPSASHTTAAVATTPRPATTRDVLNILISSFRGFHDHSRVAVVRPHVVTASPKSALGTA